MSSKDLQRVTECVSYIGQTPSRRSLPARRRHVTQQIEIDSQRPVELSVIATLLSVSLQSDFRNEKVGDLFAKAKFEPCGPVSGHDRVKHCSSVPDLIGQHLLVEYCKRDDLAHCQLSNQTESPQ